MQAHTPPLPLGPTPSGARAERPRPLSPIVALIVGLLVAGLLLELGSGAGDGAGGAAAQAAARQRALHAYGKLPMRFEANAGQTDSRVDFVARGAGYTLFLTPREAVLSLVGPSGTRGDQGTLSRPGRPGAGGERRATVRMRLAGGAAHPDVAGLKRLPGESNYLTGPNQTRWQTGVAGFGEAIYRGVYPGTDLLYHGRQGRLEYDFRLAPNADPGRIVLDFSGARKLSLNRHGSLLVHTRAGVLRQRRPVIYQTIGGHRRKVAGRFALHGHRVGFHIGRYDRSRPLVIDPELVYSTYLGTAAGEDGNGIAADAAGNAYVAGFTESLVFPTTTGAYQPGRSGPNDAFVSKLNPAGSALVYSTYLGGAGLDDAKSIAVDAQGRAYLSGVTQSVDFPTTLGAYQPAPGGNGDAFVSVLNPGGSGLAYSTYLGGTEFDQGQGIAVDSSRQAYVTGRTASDFPTKAPGAATPLQPSPGGSLDAFVAKLDTTVATAPSSQDSLVYSTYLGGTDIEVGNGIAVDGAGSAYVTGSTRSPTGFPVQGALQSTPQGEFDAFVSKLDATGSTLLYSTYLGGLRNDGGAAIALSPTTGDAYITGTTRSINFPTSPNAFDSTRNPADNSGDAFVTRLDTNASSGQESRVYSTYLGGDGDDVASGIAVDASGSAHVAGTADKGAPPPPGTFPTVDPVDLPGVRGEAFLTRLQPDGSGLSYSTYLGGGGSDVASAVALDPAGGAYVTGNTYSTDFPTRGALQEQNGGVGVFNDRDAFVAKISSVSATAPLVTGLGQRSGPVATTVAISGHGFTGASAVRFGGVAAQFTVDSDTRITATAPAHVDGPAAVTVTTPLGSSPPNPISVFRYASGTWDATGSLLTGRVRPTATLLREGTVLVAGGGSDGGGSLASSELYHPARGEWSATGPLNTARQEHTATLLPTGKVLVTGGRGEAGALSSTELYDPSSGTWATSTICGPASAGCPAPMAAARYRHTATLLEDGRVLVVGGDDNGDGTAASAELYNPQNGKWNATDAPRDSRRAGHTATRLPNGQVLLVGGDAPQAQASAELYDPPTKSWTSAGSLGFGRSNHTATLLGGGRVLIAGGTTVGGSLSSAELYDPATGGFDLTQSMASPRERAAAVLLADGKVLVAGGVRFLNFLDSAELYDPTSGRWRGAGFMTRYRAVPFAVRLTSGKVLVAGDPSSAGATSELYSPSGAVAPGPGGGEQQPPSAVAGTPPATPPGAGPKPDKTPPVITRLRVVPTPFTIGSLLPRLARVGTTIRFSLSERATVRLSFARRSGRRYRTVRPSVRIPGARAGANRVRFQGRLSRKRTLRPGRYRLTVTATDAAGNRSKPKRTRLAVKRRSRSR